MGDYTPAVIDLDERREYKRPLVVRFLQEIGYTEELPTKMSEEFINGLVKQDMIFRVHQNMARSDLLSKIENLDGQMFILPSAFRLPEVDVQLMTKSASARHFYMLHQRQNLEAAIKKALDETDPNILPDNVWSVIMNYLDEGTESNLTRTLVNSLGLLPHHVLELLSTDIKNPKIGAGFRGFDKKYRFTTWMRLIKGKVASVEGRYNSSLKKRGKPFALVKDGPYSKLNAFIMRIRSPGGRKPTYEVNFSPFSMREKGWHRYNRRSYSYAWMGQHKCGCKDFTNLTYLQGEEENLPVPFCRHSIQGEDTASNFFRGEGYHVYGNFGGMPTEKCISITLKLWKYGLIEDEDGKLRPLNDTEISQVLGMFIGKEGYPKYFTHRRTNIEDLAGYMLENEGNKPKHTRVYPHRQEKFKF